MKVGRFFKIFESVGVVLASRECEIGALDIWKVTNSIFNE